MEAPDLPTLVLTVFSQSFISDDSTMNFMVFQVLGLTWVTRNPVKLLPGIFLKAGIKKSSAKVNFLTKMMTWALRNDTPNYNKVDLEPSTDS